MKGYRPLQEVVLEEMTERILNGGFKPGQRVMENDICLQLGVSRSPVREALRQLEKDGLIRTYPNRGAVVTELTAQDIREIYAIRAFLEAQAARWAVERSQASALAGLEELVLQMETAGKGRNREAVLGLDLVFHKQLVAASQSAWLMRMADGIHLQQRRVMTLAAEKLQRLTYIEHEHRKIVAYMVSGDGEAAAALLQEHILRSGEQIASYLAAQG